MRITNNAGLPLPLAVWLLHDDYDYIDEEKYISATGIMKPVRQTVLAARVPPEDRELDVADLLASSLGTAVHDSVEHAWRVGAKRALVKLGVPQSVADKLVINPTPEQLKADPDILPCYIEQRSFREIGGYKIGGKFDMILDGRLYDHKTTSVYTYILGSKDEDYALQGGIYRWLNPDKVVEDRIHINFVFTDWQKAMSLSNPSYPKLRAIEHPVKMLSEQEVEAFIRAKLRELDRSWNLPEAELPRCTEKELWRSEPKYKFYSDPEKAKMPGARATKNFDTLVEANQHKANAGKGIVKTVPGEVKACPYCPAFTLCTQKDEYFS